MNEKKILMGFQIKNLQDEIRRKDEALSEKTDTEKQELEEDESEIPKRDGSSNGGA